MRKHGEFQLHRIIFIDTCNYKCLFSVGAPVCPAGCIDSWKLPFRYAGKAVLLHPGGSLQKKRAERLRIQPFLPVWLRNSGSPRYAETAFAGAFFSILFWMTTAQMPTTVTIASTYQGSSTAFIVLLNPT